MTAAARRQQLHQYIDMADDKKVKTIFDYIERNIVVEMGVIFL